MERQSRRAIKEDKMMITRAIVCSAIAALAVSTVSGPAAADDHGLEGTWQVRITPYVCATGVPLPPAAAIDSLMSFAAGGTMTETTSNPWFLPGQRSPGLGYWERNGHQSYEAVFQAYVPFTGGNYTQGTQRVVQDIDMVDAGHWNSTAVVAFTDLAGAPVPPSGCMRAVGVRMP
jgi:hypothetical protein